MDAAELAVWSALLGGLLTLAAGATVNALVVRNAHGLRMLLFIVVTGSSALLRTGLVEELLPGFPPGLLKLLKVCASPLAAALVIRYMALWLGGAQVDPLVHRVAVWGARAMVLCALVLGLLVAVVPPAEFYRLLRASALITLTAAVIGLLATVRAARQGDPLAGWAALAAVLLVLSVTGLFVHSMHYPGFGLGTSILTAASTAGYLLVGAALAVLRIREGQRLDRLARLETRTEPATGLPTGAALLGDVGHAFWRTARLGGECTVVCLHLANLYALAEPAGRGTEQQILTALAARIRRVAGFRCVVGLYHPRCFAVVISADQRRQYVGLTVRRLRALAAQALVVIDGSGQRHHFVPQLGVGVVVVSPADLAHADPMAAINRAEQLAIGATPPAADDKDGPATRPGAAFADTLAPAPR